MCTVVITSKDTLGVLHLFLAELLIYCSPDDRAALYIQVYTQTEEILTGEVV